MKRLIFVITLVGMGSCYAMTEPMEIDQGSATPLLLETKRYVNNSEQKYADDEKEYLVFKDLINAICNADDATVKTILDQLKKDKERDGKWIECNGNSYCGCTGLEDYFKKLIAKYPFPLVRDFTDKLGTGLKEQWPYPKAWPWPFGPLWLALEMVIYGERHNEPRDNKSLYQKRLSILQQMYDVQCKRLRKNESLVLRKNCPPDSCTCLFLICCFSWPCVFSDIKGYPMHRAVQAKSIRAYEILTAKCKTHYSDDNAWSAEQYAAFYGADDVLAYLRMHNYAHHGCCTDSSGCLACFSCNKNVKKILDADGRCCCCC